MFISKTQYLALLACSVMSTEIYANELSFGLGGGPQFGSDDRNKSLFVDMILFDYARSQTQTMSIGSSITHATTNSHNGDDTFTAISIFPELKLSTTLGTSDVFFHVRALGPSYISTKTFGSREQAMHFAFQAQIGGGIYLDPQHKYQLRLQYRHFSNANFKKPNNGIDFPLMVSLGFKF
ncbi:hypothetical protein BCU68_09975 [Vibrio sp. 10N.286.49.B3]|uniref:acyloxyacyl hydrolase n=1 Tax=Vibrio sp. 10N.286.49.B3 TaxID=1880855 RepID=UPI000C83FBB2|nr:acyloxyacyl hydrolase [Vibrio sp. 10N.286.49.B3]PMH45926.1 hypothetical protein BCU68_09975 [Vibrio sp. 10N.286.49.B3]